jgi:hypothetical protein
LPLAAIALLAAACDAPRTAYELAPSLCDQARPDASQAGNWSIQAGPVTAAEGHEPEVSGLFEVCSPAGEAPGRMALHQGGACLVAYLVPFGTGRAECRSHADCNPPGEFDRLGPPTADYFGYCARRDGDDGPPRCWTRPGPADTHCLRTVDHWRMSAGIHQIGPVNGDPLGRGEPYPEWAVFACVAHSGHDRACGEPDNPNKEVSLTPRR